MFNFWHHYYFSQVIFRLVYLATHKTFVFTDQSDFVEFIGDKNGLRPLVKYKNQIQDWPIPTSQAEFEAFL